jgi:tRNA pseudouridine55 synthase
LAKKILNPLSGLLLVDKPAGPTSHAVVGLLKRLLHPERIGHLGTLDPFASGLLPVMLGGATRLADEAMEGLKGYQFSIHFGKETDTLDCQGQVVREAVTTDVTPENLLALLPRFTGTLFQTPPAYSALKHNGRPLYEYMRAEGKLPFELESKRREIHIESLTLNHWETSAEGSPIAHLEVRCQKGTYVRCLARDLAQALGSAGHCLSLRRTFVEPWSTEDAMVLRLNMQKPPSAEEVLQRLQPLEVMVPFVPEVVFPSESHEKILNSGNLFSVSLPHWPAAHLPQANAPTSEKWLVRSGAFLCLAEISIVSDTVKVQPRKRLLGASLLGS